MNKRENRKIENAAKLGFHHGNMIARARLTGCEFTVARIAWANPAYEKAYQDAKSHALAVAGVVL